MQDIVSMVNGTKFSIRIGGASGTIVRELLYFVEEQQVAREVYFDALETAKAQAFDYTQVEDLANHLALRIKER